MTSLLNLNGLLSIGNGSSPQNGLLDVIVPGVVGVTVLPTGTSAGGLPALVPDPLGLLPTLTGSQTTSLVGDIGSGLGSAVGDIGSGVGQLLGGLGGGLSDLLGGIDVNIGGSGSNSTGVITINILGGSQITGTSGNDFLQGGAGADKLYGGAGNDILDGAGNFDTGIYQGLHTAYTITQAAGTVTVSDSVLTRDGTDTLRNMEFLQFQDGGVDIATGTFVPQSTLNSTATAYRAVVRQDAPAGVSELAGTGIASGKFTFDTYINALIDDSAHSTVPALLVASIVDGTIPTSIKLDSLTSFAQVQYDYYKNVLGSAYAELGPYEALGNAFSKTDAFQTTYASGSDTDFVSKAYNAVFGHGPSAAQQNALLDQVNYFDNLYAGAGMSAAQADIQSRGAVFGQMIGHAVSDPSEHYKAAAETLLIGFAKGDISHYGATFAA